jgi:hypothetical protein
LGDKLEGKVRCKCKNIVLFDKICGFEQIYLNFAIGVKADLLNTADQICCLEFYNIFGLLVFALA